jgi:vancomycin resistance protein VanW
MDPESFPHLLFTHASPLVRDPAAASAEFQHNKARNLEIACSRLDGTVVMPGQVFSYCRAAGPTTASAGYLPALTLLGDTLVPMTGGGLCQLSNMIFWIALHLGFRILERHRHSFDLFPDSNRTLPFGCGATVFYNYVDLRVRNELEFPVLLRFRVGDGVLAGSAFGHRALPFKATMFESDHAFYRAEGGLRRRNKIWRRVSDESGDRVELICENDCLVLYGYTGDTCRQITG